MEYHISLVCADMMEDSIMFGTQKPPSNTPIFLEHLKMPLPLIVSAKKKKMNRTNTKITEFRLIFALAFLIPAQINVKGCFKRAKRQQLLI